MAQPYGGYNREPATRRPRGLMIAVAVVVLAVVAIAAYALLSGGGGSNGGSGGAGGYFVLALPTGLMSLRRRR